MSSHPGIEPSRVVIADDRASAWSGLVDAIHADANRKAATSAPGSPAVWFEFEEGEAANGASGTHVIHAWPNGQTFNAENGFLAYYGAGAGTC